ncbi:DTW domain protein [Ostertagia ostertagi]
MFQNRFVPFHVRNITRLCKLSSYSPIEGLAKTKCLGCGKRRMYFCYDCRVLLPGVYSPQVELPCDVDIVKHPMEKNSKSTAVHCKIVAPEQTRIFDVPNVYDYAAEEAINEQGSNVSIMEHIHTNTKAASSYSLGAGVSFTVSSLYTGICSDKGSNKTICRSGLYMVPDLPCVSLTNYRTAFWRPQHNVGDYGLATIEAIYYAQREYHEHATGRPYGGEFDDLLYWFFHTQRYVDKRQDEYRKRKFDQAESAEKPDRSVSH